MLLTRKQGLPNGEKSTQVISTGASGMTGRGISYITQGVCAYDINVDITGDISGASGMTGRGISYLTQDGCESPEINPDIIGDIYWSICNDRYM